LTPRAVLSAVIAVILAMLAALAVVTLPYARLPLTAGQRRILTAGIALFLAALAYWD